MEYAHKKRPSLLRLESQIIYDSVLDMWRQHTYNEQVIHGLLGLKIQMRKNHIFLPIFSLYTDNVIYLINL